MLCLPEIEAVHIDEFACVLDVATFDFHHDVADLQTLERLCTVAHLAADDGFGGGRALGDLDDLGQRERPFARNHETDGEQHDREDQVHHHAGAHDGEALPAWSSSEGTRVGRILFAEETDETANGEPVEGVSGLAPREHRLGAGRETDAEFENLDAKSLRREEMAELVDHDED